MRQIQLRTLGSILTVAGCVLSIGCGSSSSPPAVSVKLPVDVSDEHAAKLTNENLAKIKTGMTYDDVSAILGPGLPPAVVKDDAVYEVGWVHKSSKKEIWVKFLGNNVTGSSSSKIE